MKTALSLAACTLGFDALLRRRNRHRLMILMYHGVVERDLEPFCWHQLAARKFRRQMAWVKQHYVVLPLEEALERRASGRLPERSCALTFDDGFANVRTNALPVLRALGLPATVFLTTGGIGAHEALWQDRLHLSIGRTKQTSLDLGALGLGVVPLDTPAARAFAIAEALLVLKTRPRDEKDALLRGILRQVGAVAHDPGPFTLLSWEDVTALAKDENLSFAPHSVSHQILSRCTDAEVEEEVRGSHAAVVRHLGRSVPVFAYPNGRAMDYDWRAKAAVRRAGMRWALSTVDGLAGPDDDPFDLPRIAIGADLHFARFRLLAGGLLPAQRKDYASETDW